jgi:hypothetical protein
VASFIKGTPMSYSSGVIGTFSGMNIIALPSDTQPGVTAPASIEWNAEEKVEQNVSIYTGQTQIYDLMNSFWSGTISLPPMNRYSYDAWGAFILACRGQLNCFLMGDPRAKFPKGTATGTPVVSGAAQTGYSLVTRGWTANVVGLLLPGDYISIANGSIYRLYRVTASVNSDGSGNCTIPVWPNLRDQPADGTTIITRNCVGLFRLASNNGNKFSVNPGAYGVNAISFREAI